MRRATGADIEAFSSLRERPTMKAWVGEIPGSSPGQARGPGTGHIVGIGGLAFVNGRWIAFCELSEAARHYKRAIVRAGRQVIDEARRAGHTSIYAEADENEPMAKRWLASLGFKPDAKTGLFRWQA